VKNCSAASLDDAGEFAQCRSHLASSFLPAVAWTDNKSEALTLIVKLYARSDAEPLARARAPSTVAAMSMTALDAAARPASPAPPSKAWLRALEMTAPLAGNPTRVLPAMLDRLADRFGEAPALVSERECLTYRALAGRANQYARWALEQGVAKGDVVCLLMPNRPEYLAIWLGITRVGGVVALLNTNLAGPALAHAITIVAPKHVIAAAELSDALTTALPALASGAKIWAHGGGDGQCPAIDAAIERYARTELAPAERRPLTLADRALYIYTSGTTGLPKAAAVNHHRLMLWSHWFAGMMDTQPHDRMYNCLPLYHSIGGVVATGALLVAGGSVVIREKFSARQFWDDVVRWDCTLFQYIGELCRYLVNSPPDPRETGHRLRLCCGNGLRPDVWDAFKDRFRIPQILEFYAATEANFSLFNVEGRPGAIGRIPPFLAHRFPAALVRFDVEAGEPVRDGQGRCIRCATDEVGEAIGRILDDPRALGSRFEGYSSKEDTEKKILRDVFAQGDAWFRTGDLMRKDREGYFYFIDRIGDTFRWKGENVATTEVSEAITTFPTVTEANVYGVAVPAADGRAGMAAVVVEDGFDLAAFRRHLVDRLPDYARPLFLRIRASIEATVTFKQKKSELVREGFDPALTSDAMYFDDPGLRAFVRLDAALYDRIRAGRMRL
jgi:fatty-acyl-CoA synthase